jgi:hypothetical protein
MADGGRGSSATSWRSRPDPDEPEVLADGREPFRLPTWVRRAGIPLAAVALLVAVGPRLLSNGSSPAAHRSSTAPSTSAAPVPSVSPTLPGALRWATRGDLKDDRALLDQARARVAGNELTTVVEALWAGHVRAGRAVLLAGFDSRTGIDPAFSVPVVGVLFPTSGAPSTTNVGDLSGGPDSVLGWPLPQGQALLVGPPTALNAEVSAAVTFSPDGRAHRTWVDASSPEGWSLVTIGATTHPSVAVRTELGAYSLPGPDEVNVDGVTVAGIGAPGYRGPIAPVVRDGIVGELTQPPLAGWSYTAKVGWSAIVGVGGLGQAVVVDVRRSDGATFRIGMIGGLDEGPVAFGLRTARWSHPEQQPYVFGAIGGSIGLDGRQVVSVPGGAGTLSYRTEHESGSVPIDASGVAVVDAGLFDLDPVAVTVTNRLGTRHYDRRDLFGDDPRGAGFEDRIGGQG